MRKLSEHADRPLVSFLLRDLKLCSITKICLSSCERIYLQARQRAISTGQKWRGKTEEVEVEAHTGIDLLEKLKNDIIPFLLYLFHATRKSSEKKLSRIPRRLVRLKISTRMWVHGWSVWTCPRVIVDRLGVTSVLEIYVDE
jgi:hypothetical protein